MLKDVGFTSVRLVEEPPNAAYRAARSIYHRIRGSDATRLAFRQARVVFHATKA
jgi:hypothetical protein